MANNISIKVLAEAGAALATLKEVRAGIEKAGKTSTTADTRMGRLAKTVGKGFKVAGLAAIPVAGLLVYQLHGMVDAAAAAQTAHIGLLQALAANRLSYRKNAKAIKEMLSAETELSGFTKTELTGSLGQFLRATGDLTEAQKLQNNAIDLARAKNIDLATATKTLITIQAGSYRSLKTLGIQYTASTATVDKLKKSTKDYTDQQLKDAENTDRLINKGRVLALVHKAVGGSAARWGHTAAGALAKLDASWEEIKVTIGRALIPTITDLANKFSAWIQKAGTQKKINQLIKKTQQVIQQDVIPAVKQLKTAFDDVATVVGTIADAVRYIAGGTGSTTNGGGNPISRGAGLGLHNTGGLSGGGGQHGGRPRSSLSLSGHTAVTVLIPHSQLARITYAQNTRLARAV